MELKKAGLCRRDFLAQAGVGLVGAASIGRVTRLLGEQRGRATEGVAVLAPAIADRPTWKPLDQSTSYLPGKVYEAVVPDTLDLAERARWGISGLTGMVDPDADGEMFIWVFFNTNPPTMMHSFDTPVLQPKCVEADTMLRVMCGSRQNLDLRQMSIAWLLKGLDSKDGLLWGLNRPDRPWHRLDVGWGMRWRGPGTESWGQPMPEADQDYARVYAQFRMLRALIALRQFTPDASWDEYGRRLVAGIGKMAIHKTDPATGKCYAYFPAGAGIDLAGWLDAMPRSGWKNEREPRNEKEGAEEGSIFMGWGAAPGALAVWYQMTGQKEALKLAGEFANFLTREAMWGVPNDPFVAERRPAAGQPHFEGKMENIPERSPQLAHWKGHWEGHMEALRGLLEYALVTKDVALQKFVRNGYEWARNYGLPQLGWADHQACYTPRLMAVAIKLTEAGLGDYWEDIDGYIRNNGTTQQLLDPKLLAAVVKDMPEPIVRNRIDSADRVLEKSIGLFSGHANETECLKPPVRSTITCCIPHALMGLYYAWDATVRFENATARVNLLLNRASPWLDVDSYLPYEGKVVIRNKTAQRIYVRIPAWADKEAVRVRVADDIVKNNWFENYLEISGVKPDSVLTIEFPMAETTEQLGGFTMRFKGNTLIDISPRSQTGGYPMYLRDQLKADKAPMKKVTRYVAASTLRW